MPSSKEYLDVILSRLSEIDDISYRPMMGEYLLYCRGKVFGGIYDDRFLVKATKSAVSMLPDAPMELPYDGAKRMLRVKAESKAFLKKLIEALYNELPEPKRKKER
ncbi:MAG: TfoX/Sxy family protein [Desulfovibrio sp.]|nr:TfoX/Sxy family protein [Desulfovibrio sp.]